MEGLSAVGLAAFVLVLLLWSKVQRLERILRESGIRPAAAKELGRQLERYAGREVILSLYGAEGEMQNQLCRVLESDEVWALLLCEEGKKKERKILLRLDDIKQVRLSSGRQKKMRREEEET